MSKTKTLFTMALLVLLGSMGAAQAQISPATKSFPILRTTPVKEARLKQRGDVYIIADNSAGGEGSPIDNAM